MRQYGGDDDKDDKDLVVASCRLRWAKASLGLAVAEPLGWGVRLKS